MKSLKVTYYLNEKKSINLVLKKFLYSIDVVEKLFGDSFDELNLVVAGNKSQYDNLLDTIRPPWGVTTHKNGTIYLYNPIQWRKNPTGHNLSDLTPSLIHELIHNYFFVNQIIAPVWFEEGLAVYISDENKGNKTKAFSRLKKWHEVPNVVNSTADFKKLKGKEPLMHYLTFFMFVSFMGKKFGLRKVIQFVKSIKNKQAFDVYFNKTLGISVIDTWSIFINQLKIN